jgi:hypothetical protein
MREKVGSFPAVGDSGFSGCGEEKRQKLGREKRPCLNKEKGQKRACQKTAFVFLQLAPKFRKGTFSRRFPCIMACRVIKY